MNKILTRMALVVMAVMAATGVQAQYTGNNQTITINGSVSNANGFTVGSGFTGDWLIVTNSGVLAVAWGKVGDVSGGGNVAVVTGSGSVWSNGELKVGSIVSANQLTINNSGLVISGSGYVGYNASANSNSVLVTGAGSVWTNSTVFAVGFNGGRSNLLTVADGGNVYVPANSYIISNNAALVTGTGSTFRAASRLYLNGQLSISTGGLFQSDSVWLGSPDASLLLSGAGSVWRDTGAIKVGADCPGGRVTVADGAKLFSVNMDIGNNGGASNSQVVITGQGTLWSNVNEFAVGWGDKSQGNSLIVSNGATVLHPGIWYLGRPTSGKTSNNTVVVSGTGTIMRTTGAGAIYLGVGGPNNKLTIDNGAVFDNGSGQSTFIGWNPGDNDNSALVSGSGSVWSNGYLYMGWTGGGGNSVTLTNGGTMATAGGTIGHTVSSNSTVRVTGGGSVWRNSGVLLVGNASAGNQLAITSSGAVYNTSGTMGNSAGGSNNAVRVAGAGSIWSNSTTLVVGNVSWNNQMTIANGGKVYNTSGTIGSSSGADSNTVRVSGSGSVWRTTGTLTVNTTGRTGNGLILSTGGVAAVSGNVAVGTGGYITNFVAGTAGGLDMASASTLTLNGKMGIVFAGAPTQLGPYWGLRWAGDHTNTLKALTNTVLTITDGPDLPARWRNKAAIYYDGATTATYIGFNVTTIPGAGTILIIR